MVIKSEIEDGVLKICKFCKQKKGVFTFFQNNFSSPPSSTATGHSNHPQPPPSTVTGHHLLRPPHHLRVPPFLAITSGDLLPPPETRRQSLPPMDTSANNSLPSNNPSRHPLSCLQNIFLNTCCWVFFQ